MSELRSVLEGLRAEVLAELPDARIEEDFAELQRAAELIEVERLRRLAELERRGVYAPDGHLSTAAWLASSQRAAFGTARADVRLARAVEQMPEARRALESGDVSLSAVKVLAHAREADPEVFQRDEHTLVDAARRHTVGDLQKVASHWRQRAERGRSFDGDGALRDRRSLNASVSFGGMVRVDGDLDPETGETVLTALRAVLDSEARSRHDDDRRNCPNQEYRHCLAPQFLPVMTIFNIATCS